MLTRLATMLFLSAVVMNCSRTPTLNEEELISALVKLNHVGPLNFRRDVWPTLEDKTITYCGQLQEVKKNQEQTMLLVNVDKQVGGESLPWSLEGKATTADVKDSYNTSDPVCMTGVLEGFSEVQEQVFRGYVRLQSVTKSTTP